MNRCKEQIRSAQASAQRNTTSLVVNIKRESIDKLICDLALLAKRNWEAALKLAETLGSKQAWNQLAQESLKDLQFDTSKHCYARCKDFAGIQFVKKLTGLEV
jgi:hypothetical protein